MEWEINYNHQKASIIDLDFTPSETNPRSKSKDDWRLGVLALNPCL